MSTLDTDRGFDTRPDTRASRSDASFESPNLFETRALLAEVARAHDRMCLCQMRATRAGFDFCFGRAGHADVVLAASELDHAHARLASLREDLKRVSPRAWRIHTYGLALVLEAESGLAGGDCL